jgi:hypothetical protein
MKISELRGGHVEMILVTLTGFAVGFSIVLLIYWLSGAEFERSLNLAATTVIALVFGAISGAVGALTYQTARDALESKNHESC